MIDARNNRWKEGADVNGVPVRHNKGARGETGNEGVLNAREVPSASNDTTRVGGDEIDIPTRTCEKAG